MTLAAFGLALLALSPAPGDRVVIVQTNAAGDNVFLIDPASNTIVGEIEGIEVNHGAAAAPDGSRLYFTNEANETLDVVDVKSLAVTKSIPLSGRPNNVAISRDGRRVYVAIVSSPGAVDVIDTPSLERDKTIPTRGGVHNTFVTPDGRHVIAGSIVGKNLTVIDQETEEPLWTLYFENGVRPIGFETNPDGTTRRMFVQISNFHGFFLVDFENRKEVGTNRASGASEGGAELGHAPGLALSWDWGRARWKDPLGLQQSEPRRLRLFPSRPETSRRRRSRAPPRLAHLHSRQQDGLRGERGIELGLRGGHRVAEGSRAYPRRPGPETEHHRNHSLNRAVLLVLAFALGSGPASAQRVVLVSVDGLRPDFYLNPEAHGVELPTLRSLMAEGVYAEAVESVYPTLTYSPHTSIVTGALPSRHGIVNDTVFDERGGSMTGTGGPTPFE